MVRGRQSCERVGKGEKRADGREIGCQKCREDEKKKARGMTRIEKEILQVKTEENRRDGAVGDEGKERADKMNWS